MTQARRVDGWDFLTLLLWSLFFAAGLVPEPVFVALRTLARVPAHNAFVNSSAVITVALALYFALFVRRCCLNAGLSPGESQGRATQAGLIALVAFLEVPQSGIYSDGRTLLYLVIRSQDIADTYLKSVILAAGACKLIAWWYLYSLVLRYHAFGTRDVFVRMATMFPSARSNDSPKDHTPTPPKTDDAEEPDKIHTSS